MVLDVWVLHNRTPFAADRTWVRDKDGAHVWIVAVKATFQISLSGMLRLADTQPPPLLLPVYNGKLGLSSLRYEADLVPQKATTDILLAAQAFAPKGRAVRSLLVSGRIGPAYKQLLVHGPRYYRKGIMGLSLTSPAE